MKISKWLILLFLITSFGSAFAANGDVLLSSGSDLRIKYLDAQSASDDGVYVELHQVLHKTFHVDAIETGGTIEIKCRDDATKPANSLTGPILFTLTPTVLAGVDKNSWRWCKAEKTAGGTPAPSTLIMEGWKR